MTRWIAAGGAFVVSLDLVERRALGTAVAGVMFMLTPLGTAVAAPIAGRLTDRLGPRAPMLAGLVVEAAGLLGLSRAGTAAPLWGVALALLAAGLGLGLLVVPNMVQVMREFPPGQQGAAGGFAFLARTLGIVVGVIVIAQVFAWRRAAGDVDGAYAAAFLTAVAFAGTGALLAALPVRGRGGGV